MMTMLIILTRYDVQIDDDVQVDDDDFFQTLHGPGIRVRYSQHLNCIDTDLVN